MIRSVNQTLIVIHEDNAVIDCYIGNARLHGLGEVGVRGLLGDAHAIASTCSSLTGARYHVNRIMEPVDTGEPVKLPEHGAPVFVWPRWADGTSEKPTRYPGMVIELDHKADRVRIKFIHSGAIAEGWFDDKPGIKRDSWWPIP